MKPHKLLLFAIACTWTLGALAQYEWIDKDGRRVFSDRPPPMDVPAAKILQQPRALERPASINIPAADGGAASAAPQPAAPAAGAPAVTGKDKQLEEEKAKAEAAEAAKKQAEDKARAEKDAQARAENCASARRTVQTLQPGRLVGSTNAKGERTYMDDATRAAELRRAQGVIQTDCK